VSDEGLVCPRSDPGSAPRLGQHSLAREVEYWPSNPRSSSPRLIVGPRLSAVRAWPICRGIRSPRSVLVVAGMPGVAHCAWRRGTGTAHVSQFAGDSSCIGVDVRLFSDEPRVPASILVNHGTVTSILQVPSELNSLAGAGVVQQGTTRALGRFWAIIFCAGHSPIETRRRPISYRQGLGRQNFRARMSVSEADPARHGNALPYRVRRACLS